MTRAWYVVQTRAGQEKAVSRAIGSTDAELACYPGAKAMRDRLKGEPS